MSGLARWSPLRDALRLHDELDRFFVPRSFAGWSADAEKQPRAWTPPVDVYEDAEGITLRAELPGLSAQDIDVRVENGTLTLEGERKLEREDRKDDYRRIERWHGKFSRSFALPTTVDAEKVKAESRNGVLQIFLPRREETKPRQIKVNVQ